MAPVLARTTEKCKNVRLAHTFEVCLLADLSTVVVELGFFGFLSPFCAFLADNCIERPSGLVRENKNRFELPERDTPEVLKDGVKEDGMYVENAPA